MKSDKQDMDVYSAVRWSAVSKYGAQGVQVVVSLVLARLLAPEYFGLLGMATVITGFVGVFKNLGFSSAIIQRHDVDDVLLSTLFWVNLAACLLVAAVVAGVAPLIAWMYGDSRMTPIIAVLSLNFIFTGLSMIPDAILTRQMAFNKLAVREIVGVLVNGTTAVTLAFAGWGVWALVAGALAGTAAQMILINLVRPFVPRWCFDRQGLRECLGFGLNVTGFGIFNYFARNADNLLIGIVLGPLALGYYSLAYRLMLLPKDAVTGVLTRVLFPKLSRLQDNDAKLADVYVRANAAIAFVTFPMMLGFASIARPFVEVVMGSKWLPALPVIYILAALGALQSVWSPVGQIFLAKGRADWYFRWGGVGGVVFVASFVAGLPWGIVGVASAYAFVCLLWIPFSWWIAFRLVDGLTVPRFLNAVTPYVAMSGIMVAGVICARLGLERAAIHPTVSLLACVLIGAAIYASLTLIGRPPALGDFGRLLPNAISRPLRAFCTRLNESS